MEFNSLAHLFPPAQLIIRDGESIINKKCWLLILCHWFPHWTQLHIALQRILIPTPLQSLVLLQFNQDLYSSSGVPLAASSNASGSSHSPCSPILPPSIVQSQVAAAAAVSSHHTAASSVPTIPLSALHRHITKEEDLSATRSDNEGESPVHSSSKGKMGTTPEARSPLYSFRDR